MKRGEYMGNKSVAEKYMVEQFVGRKSDMGHGRQEYG